jgi:hypothetical protein
MTSTYGGVTLGAGGLLGEPGGFRVNNKQITEAANFFRAAAMSWFSRANVSTEVGFSITRSYGSLAAASVAFATGVNTLPGQGDLVFVQDATTLTLPAAVFTGVNSVMMGVSITTTYAFSGGIFTS